MNDFLLFLAGFFLGAWSGVLMMCMIYLAANDD